MKFIGAVLHSSASTQKWSRTSNVNAVFGFLKLAGKSFARRRSWTYWSGDLAQWHHRTERVKIPVDETMVRLDRDPKFVIDSEGSEGWYLSGRSSPSSDRSSSNIIWVSVLGGMEPQSSRWWKRSKRSLCARRSDGSKNRPFHIWTRWNGRCAWAETQQVSHQKFEPKQSWHRYVPEVCWQFEHDALEGRDSCWRISMRMLCLRLRYSLRNSFCVWRPLSNYKKFTWTVIHTFPTVLERLGIWSVLELSLLSSGTPGDRARFFEGDTLREGAGEGCESLTGTCVIIFPRQVWVVVTSNRSGFDLEFLIFGIERLVYAGMWAQGRRKIEMGYR